MALNSAQNVRESTVETHQLKDGGSIPNNAKLPLLIYKGALKLSGPDPAAIVEQLFQTHDWSGCWRNGIYPYHHYHSTAHEVLGVYRGSATVQFGGDQGITASVNAGDVVLIPAGVGHKRLECTDDFGVVGAYPRGQDWDMCRGESGERPEADQRIDAVRIPDTDPVYGKAGPLRKFWRQNA